MLKFGLSYTLMVIVVMFSATSFSKKQDPKATIFFVGTYTSGESEGIYRFQLNADGTMENSGLAAKTENPSFLAWSKNRKYLLAANENSDDQGGGGSVTSFRHTNNNLTYVNKKSSGGASPCFVGVNPAGYVLAANYSSGNIGLLKLSASGTLEGPLDVLQHEGKGTHTRQNAPHAHSAWFDPYGDKVITIDLGTNELWFSKLNPASNSLEAHTQQKLAMGPGAGPRHLTFHPNGKWIYVINELSSTVTLVKKNRANLYEMANSTSTLPADFTGENFCADIHISQDGKFLYGSNRGHNSIVIFRINDADGTLSLVGHESVHGDWPRNFALSPADKYLLVANQRSNNIVSFKRDANTGTLTYVSEIKAPTPVCILF